MQRLPTCQLRCAATQRGVHGALPPLLGRICSRGCHVSARGGHTAMAGIREAEDVPACTLASCADASEGGARCTAVLAGCRTERAKSPTRGARRCRLPRPRCLRLQLPTPGLQETGAGRGRSAGMRSSPGKLLRCPGAGQTRDSCMEGGKEVSGHSRTSASSTACRQPQTDSRGGQPKASAKQLGLPVVCP